MEEKERDERDERRKEEERVKSGRRAGSEPMRKEWCMKNGDEYTGRGGGRGVEGGGGEKGRKRQHIIFSTPHNPQVQPPGSRRSAGRRVQFPHEGHVVRTVQIRLTSRL